MKKMPPSTLTVPNDLSCLSAIQAYAAEMAKAVGFPAGETARILLALEEAVVNVVEHAFDPPEEATYQVVFEPMPTGLKIIIREKGLPFVPEEIPEYIPPADMEQMPKKGLGSFLMRKSVDEVIFHNMGREGNELQLVKYLPFKTIVDLQDASELERYPEPSKDEAPREKKHFEIRLMRPDECLQVSRLFYRAYGYSYVYDSMYYPEKFAQLHKDGLIVSVVADVDGYGIAGHVALTRESLEDKIAEAGKAAVHPEFRGYGVFNTMMEALIEEGRRIGLSGIFGEAVTNHEYTQRAELKVGLRRCGLAVGMIPSDMSFKAIHVQLPQRESVAYSFLPLSDRSDIVVYPPAHHKGFLEGIYANIDVRRIFADAEEAGEPQARGSSVKTSVVPAHGFAAIEVYSYGKEVVSEIRNIVKELKATKLEEVRLFLNLGDPMTPRFCAEFEGLGFFIAGLLPYASVGDALILQYLNNVTIDYDRICAVGEAAQQILAYIRGHDPNIR
jgi:serine/threonine-protein kinase RsbW